MCKYYSSGSLLKFGGGAGSVRIQIISSDPDQFNQYHLRIANKTGKSYINKTYTKTYL